MRSHWYENEFFYYHLNKNHFQKNGFALILVFKVRDFELGSGLFGLSLPSSSTSLLRL